MCPDDKAKKNAVAAINQVFAKEATAKSPCKCGLLNLLCKIWTVIRRRKRKVPCLYLPARIVRRPEPNIYSQFFLLQLQQPVTWDNPDIKIFLNNIEQYTYDLKTDTEYDIQITVHSSSSVEPADGTRVEVRWIEFGAGAQIRHHVTTLFADVPVFPGTAVVAAKWRTPATPGHYCIEVELFHERDALTANNRGWNNTQVHEASSPVEFSMRVFNRNLPQRPRLFDVKMKATNERLYNLIHGFEERETPTSIVEMTFDSYVFPTGDRKTLDPLETFKPMPPFDERMTVEPHTFSFKEGEPYRDVTVRVNAPDTMKVGDIKPVNITAWQGGFPSGGITAYIKKKG